MELMRAMGEASNGPPPARLQGLLGSIPGPLDEPLEAGTDRPPEETIVPKEEAIDYEGEKFVKPAASLPKIPDVASIPSLTGALPSSKVCAVYFFCPSAFFNAFLI